MMEKVLRLRTSDIASDGFIFGKLHWTVLSYSTHVLDSLQETISQTGVLEFHFVIMIA